MRKALCGVAVVVVLAATGVADAGPPRPLGEITLFADPAGMVDAPTGIWGGWFTSQGNDRIGYLDPWTDVMTTYGGRHRDIDGPNHVVRPNGYTWFTNEGNDRIGRLNSATGRIRSFADPWGRVSDPGTMALDRDQGVWFTNCHGDRVGHVTHDGRFTFVQLGHGLNCRVLRLGNEGHLWTAVGDEGRLYTVDPRTGTVRPRNRCRVNELATIEVVELAIHYYGDLHCLVGGTPMGSPSTGARDWYVVHVDPSTHSQQASFVCTTRDDLGEPVPDLAVTFGGAWVSCVDEMYRLSTWDGDVQRYGDPEGRVGAITAVSLAGDGRVWFTSTSTDLIGRVVPWDLSE